MKTPLLHLGLAAGLLVVSAASAGAAEWPCFSEGSDAEIRFQGPSPTGDVFVVDAAGYRHLRFGSPCSADQSVVSLTDPEAVPTEYVRLAATSLVLVEQVERVLMVGLGGGTFTSLVARVRPTARIDAVEIDPVVVEAARRFFGVRFSARLRLHVEDAAHFFERSERDFDVIFLDTYGAAGMPAHLGTQAYFEAAVRRLRPGGVLVANFGVGTPGAYVDLARRLRQAAGDALCISAREEANLVVFAGAPGTLRAEGHAARAEAFDADARLPFSLAELAGRLRDCL